MRSTPGLSISAMVVATIGVSVFLGAWPLAAQEEGIGLKHLREGTLAAGEEALIAHLEGHSDDDVARLELGITQFLRAWEKTTADLYQHGLRTDRIQMTPFGQRINVPPHPDPKVLTASGFRHIVQNMVTDLKTAEATLAQITSDDLKLVLPIEEIKLDLLGSGDPIPVRVLLDEIRVPGPRGNQGPIPPVPFVVALDKGDVHWLRGYCHFMAGWGEILLAHDGTEFFHRVGHLFFQRPDTPYEFFREEADNDPQRFDFSSISDFIAAIHLLNFPLDDATRMEAALEHFQAMMAQSKLMWDCYLAETDDDREWIPNPNQTGVLGVKVTQQMVDTWLKTIEAAEAVLAGEKRVPFWRGTKRADYGLNLNKVFTEPRDFDLILWIQGTAAAPYLEEGEVTPLASPEHLQRINRDFGMNFLGFMMWFN